MDDLEMSEVVRVTGLNHGSTCFAGLDKASWESMGNQKSYVLQQESSLVGSEQGWLELECVFSRYRWSPKKASIAGQGYDSP
ncbi:hypothetical protein EBH_0084760 [Eimeria brunetti]|uniref:Uncharacterized protein n=1 Tax=Eimeria brunetti TaxID=51314 RepID=U6M032_9EIME|nr:hypothetical protein EBH_0084760 [Eimeria brunetti]